LTLGLILANLYIDYFFRFCYNFIELIDLKQVLLAEILIRKVIMYGKQYFVYILSNKNNTVLYIGITSNLLGRIFQHKDQATKGFTSRYNVDKLVYYEIYEDVYEAISREKQLKSGSRRKKVDLVNNFNKQWEDLCNKL
jgi:putative endonuclease